MSESKQFRDVYNPLVINDLSKRLKGCWGDFQEEKFCGHINPKLKALSYSERIDLIVDGLEKYLPKDFPKAVEVLLCAQLPPYGSEELKDTYERFITVPQTYYISKNGLKHFELSLSALYEMTKRFSSEFGIRAFIEAEPERSLNVLKTWAKDNDPHVRRLVSEGSRPYLPWGKKLYFVEENPEKTIELLELLKADSSEYVRRSVANHLNDLSKMHPDLVVKTLTEWRKTVKGKDFERMAKHALRSLIKQGHEGSLSYLGYRADVEIEVKEFKCTPSMKISESLHFSFDIKSKSKQKEPLIVDYRLYFVKANGTTAPKVFKLKTCAIQPNETLKIEKKHPIKPITTRVYYAGEHFVEILVNGNAVGKLPFQLDL